MNTSAARRALDDLSAAASELSAICAREKMEQFAPFWRSVADAAAALSASPDRIEVQSLVRDVLGAFSYVPGGFMDLYIIRKDPNAQLRENDAFDALRVRAREAAQRLNDAANENEINPLQVRRVLVELEGELLDEGAKNEAANVRGLLNAAELDLEAVRALCLRLEVSASPMPRVEVLLKNLRSALMLPERRDS